jgi:hypothetical protein
MVMTIVDAKAAALNAVSGLYRSQDDELVILDDKTVEKSYGWIFFFNSKRFLETCNFLYALGGNGPIVVERESGRVTRLGTARPVEEEVAAFEREHNF